MSIVQTIKSLDGKDIAKIASLVAAIAGAAGTAGWFAKGVEPAICLDSPFSMRLACGGGTNDFERLILTEDTTLGNPEKGRRFLRLRQVRTSFDIEPVGVITAQDFRKAKKQGVESFNAVGSVEAAPPEPFTWRGHDNDVRFKEWFDQKAGEMVREYADGCILGYKNDATGKSIPATFRWIKKTH